MSRMLTEPGSCSMSSVVLEPDPRMSSVATEDSLPLHLSLPPESRGQLC